MMDDFNRDALHRMLIADKNVIFDTEEEYFFILGQFLMYVFYRLGGIQRHHNAFHYLTNPYLPHDVQQLGLRTVRFFSKLPTQMFHGNENLSTLVSSLVEHTDLYLYSSVDIPKCTEAFFHGIHSKNLFIEIYAKHERQ
jgi:hypothetical protein